MQKSNTKYSIFQVQDLVADASRFVELAPGDIVSTGTAGELAQSASCRFT